MRLIYRPAVFTILLLLFTASLSAQEITPQAKGKLVQADKITAELQQKKIVPVIARLNIETGPYKGLSDAELEQQKIAIESAQSRVMNRLHDLSVRNVKRPSSLPFISMFATEAVLNELGSSDDVTAIFFDEPHKPMLDASTVQIGANTAWDYGYDGSGQTVVILDTGVDIDHIFFTGRIAGGACFSTNFNDSEFPDTVIESLCPNGLESEIGSNAGRNCSTTEDDPFCGHGTHVAGIAAGSNILVNGTPINGVARGANLYAVQVFSLVDDEGICGTEAGDNPCVRSYTSDQVSALNHILTYNDNYTPLNFASINMSLGTESTFTEDCNQEFDNGGQLVDRPIKIAIDALRADGIATIVSSGNGGVDNGISSPACISSAISVGAVDGNDDVANFSNSDDILDLLAPGVDILSSLPDNGAGTIGGTSMAAPHVAGAVALMKQADPSATVDEILTKFQNQGVNVTDIRNGLTFSRIQVDQALSSTFTAEIAASASQQNEGWRFLASPGLTTYGDLLSTLWTQGPLNSKAEDDEATVLDYDGSTYTMVPDLSSTLEPGKGLAVYVFEDDDFDTNPDGWPKTIDVFGLEPNQDVVLDDLLNPSSDGSNVYSLLGNPFNTTIDFDDFTNQDQIGGVVYVYDHNFEPNPFESPDTAGDPNVTTDAGGGFRAWNGTDGSLNNGLIAPFQGFFVYATGSNPTLTIPESAKSSGGTFYKEAQQQPVASASFSIRVSLEDRLGDATWLTFTETGSIEQNRFDAPYLYPLDYRELLTLFTGFGEDGYLIKNLPYSFNEPLQIPLIIQAWEPDGNSENPGYIPAGGEAEFEWENLSDLPPNWSITLTDHKLGTVIDMRERSRYDFELTPSPGKLQSLPYEMSLRTADAQEAEKSRFTVTVYPEPNELNGETEQPVAVSLDQNYPNPFNPSTVIRYSLPESSDVRLEVFSVDGKRVSTLVNEQKAAGEHTAVFRTGTLPSGIYFYRLQAGQTSLVRKMAVIR